VFQIVEYTGASDTGALVLDEAGLKLFLTVEAVVVEGDDVLLALQNIQFTEEPVSVVDVDEVVILKVFSFDLIGHHQVDLVAAPFPDLLYYDLGAAEGSPEVVDE